MDGFAERLLAWYDRAGRKGLPWQRARTPYRVWVAEIMLQQTRVATVVPYFERFTARFPDLGTLAAAELDEVLALWSGLGYYSRARSLHRAARQIQAERGGQFPQTLEALLALPGIGRSTAGAILAQAMGQRHPILDGNVKRVLCRYHAVEGWPGESGVERRLWELAEHHTPEARLADYTQAIMDLGATLCRRTGPECSACPVAPGCSARCDGAVERYPSPKPRKALPMRKTTMLLLVNERGELLLERRPPAGIWGGLWSLPEPNFGSAPDAWVKNRFGCDIEKGVPLPPVRHTFTHFRLVIDPIRFEARTESSKRLPKADLRWCSAEAIGKLGLPAPVRKLVRATL